MESPAFMDIAPALDGTVSRPAPDAIRQQLDRLLVTRFFRTSPRLRRFLCFTVEQVLSGLEGRLKEYCIALEVFGKPDSFDPRIDSAVRVAARQLRAKLDSYYLSEGAQDEILIRFRPGDYVPRFYRRPEDFLSFGGESLLLRQEHTRAVIVDKERSTVRAIVEALDTLNCPVAAVVDNGEEALEVVRNLGGALLITGLVLAGGMNGLELTRLMHASASSPVILISPPDLPSELLDEVVVSAPDAMIFKPIRCSDVGSAIRLAIAKRGRIERPMFETDSVVSESSAAA